MPVKSSADETVDLLRRAISQQSRAQPPTRSLLREEVYAQIRAWVVEGHLPPGTRLRDKEIAEALQVSRTPVREAIRRLQDEHLVVAEASRWTKVAPVDVEEADRIYPIVWSLERLATTLGGGWNAAAITRLRAVNEELALAIERDDAVAASSADTEFHRLIVEAASNPELTAIVDDLKVRLRRIEISYFDGSAAAEPSIDEHRRAIDALEAEDLETAGLEIERNWRASLDRLHQRLRSDRTEET